MPRLTVHALDASVTFADPYPYEGQWSLYAELGQADVVKDLSADQLQRITPALVAQAALNHITWSVADVPGDPGAAVTLAMLASTSHGLGASLVGVEDQAPGKFTAVQSEAALREVKTLADATAVVANTTAHVAATPGVEGASNDIDVVCQIKDAGNVNVSVTTPVMVVVVPTTDAQGDVAAATTPVGTLVKATVAAGPKTAWFTPVAGAFSFKITDTVAEDALVTIYANGCLIKTFTLSFAG